MKVWALTDGPVKEGKYLVVRRDGTIPPWGHFVLAAIDPRVPAALEAYAREAEALGDLPDYVQSIRELADQYRLAAHEHNQGGSKKPDPDQPPHRVDNPAVVAMMRGEGDLTQYRP